MGHFHSQPAPSAPTFILLYISFDHTGVIRAQEARPSSAAAAQAAWGAKEGELCLGCHSGLNPRLNAGMAHQRSRAEGNQLLPALPSRRAERYRRVQPQRRSHFSDRFPKDCGRCHQQQVDEQKGSHHAKAGQILASLDNFLGEVLGGPPAVAVGCLQCHGSTIKVLPGGKFDPATWPNTGIGRINPDGSWDSAAPAIPGTTFPRRRRASRKPAANVTSALIIRRSSLSGVGARYSLVGEQEPPQCRARQMDSRHRLRRRTVLRDLSHERHAIPGRDP